MDHELILKLEAAYIADSMGTRRGRQQWEREQHLLSRAFWKPITDRGFLKTSQVDAENELLTIAQWKWPPTAAARVERDEKVVALITRESFRFASNDETSLAVHMLTYLRGVHTRMASAILTVFNPRRFTVLDVNSWKAMGRLARQKEILKAAAAGNNALDRPRTYAPYLHVCLELAAEHKVDLRRLDRALFMIGKYDLYPREKAVGWLESHRLPPPEPRRWC